MPAISSAERPDTSSDRRPTIGGEPVTVSDVHIHIQPWSQMKPEVLAVMAQGKKGHVEFLMELMNDPSLLLRAMDEDGIDRVGMVNYPSPNIMGFDDSTNEWIVRYAEADRRRLLPYGGVDPLTNPNTIRAVEHLVEIGTRVCKIHPCHMGFAANAYTDGLTALGDLYRTCEKHGLPVMVHTGTSIFPRARSKYGNPMELDDIAIDFPDLPLIMAHGGRPLYMAEAFFVLRRHRKVWLDLSGIPPRSLLEYFPRIEELTAQLLWGTDWPSPGVSRMRGNIDQFLALSIADGTKRVALEENPRRLLPDRAR
jgi:predicted TIM-barrel fold metal-dependent hydrolase